MWEGLAREIYQWLTDGAHSFYLTWFLATEIIQTLPITLQNYWFSNLQKCGVVLWIGSTPTPVPEVLPIRPTCLLLIFGTLSWTFLTRAGRLKTFNIWSDWTRCLHSYVQIWRVQTTSITTWADYQTLIQHFSYAGVSLHSKQKRALEFLWTLMLVKPNSCSLNEGSSRGSACK